MNHKLPKKQPKPLCFFARKTVNLSSFGWCWLFLIDFPRSHSLPHCCIKKLSRVRKCTYLLWKSVLQRSKEALRKVTKWDNKKGYPLHHQVPWMHLRWWKNPERLVSFHFIYWYIPSKDIHHLRLSFVCVMQILF